MSLKELLDWVSTLYKKLSQNKSFQLIRGIAVWVIGISIISGIVENLIASYIYDAGGKKLIGDVLHLGMYILFFLLAFACGGVFLLFILQLISRAKNRSVSSTLSRSMSSGRLLFLQRRWLLIMMPILIIVSMVAAFFLRPLLFPVAVPAPVSNSLCDGNCMIDVHRVNTDYKSQAIALGKQGNHVHACAYWDAAVTEDATDGEARIYREDQCASALASTSYYINVVVATQIVDGNDPMNSVNRAILQGVAERQSEFNNAHPAGPKLYIFLTNLASQTQQDAAQQIIDATKSRSHPIAGVIGSLFGLDTFVNTLSSASIPMISIAPVDDSTLIPYLLSLAPSFQEQARAAMRYMQNQAAQNNTTLHVALYFTSRTDDTYSREVADAFRAAAGNALVDDSAYTATNMIDLVHEISNLSDDHKPNFIYLAGPSDDASQFQAALHQYGLHVQVLTADSMYQWVYQNHTPEMLQNFLGITFTASAYHHPEFIHDLTSPLSPECSVQGSKPSSVSSQYDMVKDYKRFFDPGDVYFGSPYTHDLASSDALLAYDALSLVDAAPGIAAAASSAAPTATMLWTALEKFSPTNPFPGKGGQISFQANRSAPYQKAVLLINIVMNSGNNLVAIEHTSATVWAGCYQLYPA